MFYGIGPHFLIILPKKEFTQDLQKEGIEGIHVLDVDDSKQSEAFEFIGKRILALSTVPGFKCASSPWSTIEEALKMVGM